MTAPERIWAWHHKDAMLDNRQWADNPYARYRLPSTEYVRADLAAVQPVPEALHRSFQDAFDGRPMPPMGDELMIAGLSVDDARFVAVQLAQNGLTLTAQPDPRGEVIKGLVEALEWQRDQLEAHPFMKLQADAALAAAKAVQR